ncbi:hypothetical protein [[Kitasatospora] papulosa]|uniref:hypothetical protein n=1 Tax=[Kitasatospora] papulosa TaxID=1464011 RepID=UPI00369CBB2C
MTDRPIIPTRVIPAGAPLPDRGPLPGELPPWYAAAPAAATAPAAAQPPAPPTPPAAAPAPAAPEPLAPQLHFHLVAPYYEEPEPTRRERLWAWVRTIGRPWQACGALVLALVPIPGLDYSVATTWAYCVSAARDQWGQEHAYALALTPLGIAVISLVRNAGPRGGLGRLLLLAVSIVGLTGAMNLYDPITWITGVRP